MDEVSPDSVEVTCLLQQATAGDAKAIEQLFARQRSDLQRFIALRLGDALRFRLDVSDVIQETHLEAFRRFDDFLKRRPMPFHLWLRKTAYERILMLRRRHVQADRRSVGRETPLGQASSELLAQRLIGSGSTPSKQLDKRELAEHVRGAVATLPEADQEILMMRTYEALSYEEIACLLDIDAAAARKRHGRALLRLQRALAASGVTESQL
jgi:RNA polymerase sigma-70 factor, ECF subfamily